MGHHPPKTRTTGNVYNPAKFRGANKKRRQKSMGGGGGKKILPKPAIYSVSCGVRILQSNVYPMITGQKQSSAGRQRIC